MDNQKSITIRAFLIGMIVTVIFAIMTVYLNNVYNSHISATQIPLLPYVFLFIMVLVVNPLCRLIRVIRPFNQGELLIILTMGVVTGGISLFGLSAQVVPIVANLFNPQMNSRQAEWDRHIEPYVHEAWFISEPGIQAAARKYLKAADARDELRDLYAVAQAVVSAKAGVDAAETQLAEVQAADLTKAEKDMAVSRAQTALTVAREVYGETVTAWQATGEPDAAATMTAAKTKLETQNKTVEETRKALAELEAIAFKRVEMFRNGLPDDLRAYPGIVFTLDDTLATYTARLGRCVRGRKAVKTLRDEFKNPSDNPAVAIDEAIAVLEPLSNTAQLEADVAQAQELVDSTRAELVSLGETLKERYETERFAKSSERKALKKQIYWLEQDRKELDKDLKHLERRRETIARELATNLRLDTLTTQLRTLKDGLLNGTVATGQVKASLAPILRAFPGIDVSLRRLIVGDVPWGVWKKPLILWGIITILLYAVLMSFNALIFRQWAYHEKVVYPYAELQEELAGKDAAPGVLPPVYRSGLFWAGALIAGSILGWNLFAESGIVPGVTGINLTHKWTRGITGTIFEGLIPYAKSTIFFTLIGIAFLIPQRVSFSMWFFVILYMIQLLVLVWLGYGVNENSFPSDWLYTMSFKTAEGGGALLVFSAVALFKARHYFLSCFRPTAVAGLEAGERLELRIQSGVFLLGSAGLIIAMWHMGMHPVYAVITYAILILLTTGLIRAVAEGGIIMVQPWAGPLHFIKTTVGMVNSWSAPWLMSPFLIFYAVFFFDLKTFIAPAMANGLKIRADLKMKRRHFYTALFAAIVLAVVVAVGTEIMMSYNRGANAMSWWFHTGLPQITYAKTAELVSNPPSASPAERNWMIAGAVLMAGLLFFRRRIFWLPHPLGLILLVNHHMTTFWFSIMLGWLAKTIVTKLGSKDAYARIKPFFIGLIFGELMLVAAAAVVSIQLDKFIGITLNLGL
ncbi:MAG TPA: hypothetical protein DIT01_01605 [Lentisphaeria bacterium]|nr:hypothetical protein [Lentisphaeria bacterium]|tara:strand:+ start:2060 stop:4978 length:2919 start_codon:yes stop_codon:yes gene_type:complete